MFQVVDDLEIFLIDADDLLPDGTATFGLPFCAWFRFPSCAVAAFFLVGSDGRDGLIFWSLESWWVHLWLSRCAASSAASCRGNSCRVSGAGMIVAMLRGFATLFLALMGSSEGSFTDMSCVLAWFGLLARGCLVTSNGPIHLGPGSACLGLPADGVRCLCTQDPVAHCLLRRCALHSLCPCVNFVLFRTCRPCLRVLNPWSFQRVFNVSRFLVWLRAKHASTCDGFFFPKSCSMDSSRYRQVASTVLE